ncbi:related to 30s ribosomal protein s18 [Ustilago trichophora]|uniref:Small ribosomal subunit protein bS18m n=1 Tax=Ustilago trichophora TaxID=86804 RepID=A0A5C3DXV3_9BASI|nr:related to 30s ribosomal protein s18 [Ustilago trichophora]
MRAARSLISSLTSATGSTWSCSCKHTAGTIRTFASTNCIKSALDELSTSIEKLALSRTSSPPSPSSSASSSSTSSTSGSGIVHNPRSSSSRVTQRQTVSGRAFMNGHYYNPSTLSYDSITSRPARLSRPLLGPKKSDAIKQDLIHQNGLNPGKPSLHDDSYKNAAILANYVSEMGKILGRSSSGLTRKSQRAVGKAVRRARSMGLLPVMSRGGARVGGAGWK